MLYTVLLGISMGFAQPEESSPVDTPVEVKDPMTSTGSDVVSEPLVLPTQEAPSDVNLLLVQMTLHNGIVLTGSMEFQQVLTWTPQSTDAIRFYMDTGVQNISSSTVASIVQISEESTGTGANVEEVSQPEVKEIVEEPKAVQTPSENAEFAPGAGEFSFQNPAASRYLYAPSSIPLQKGQGYVSQKLIFTSGVIGVSDNVTLLVGTTVLFHLYRLWVSLLSK